MKKTMNFMLVIFGVMIMAASAGAQMMGGGQDMMTERGAQQEQMTQNQADEPDMMYPGEFNCYGMGPGMMGGYGMMPGYGMGPGMMGGYGMDPDMMGGYGMGYRDRHRVDGNRGRRGMPRFGSSEDYNKFLDETKELRRKLHDMRFEYGEMMRDPKTTIGELQQKRQEMLDLQKDIFGQKVK